MLLTWPYYAQTNVNKLSFRQDTFCSERDISNRSNISIHLYFLTDLFCLCRPCSASVARLKVFLIDSSFGFREQVLIFSCKSSIVNRCDTILESVSSKRQLSLRTTNCDSTSAANVVFILVNTGILS